MDMQLVYSSQCQVKSNFHAMTYLFDSSNALFMITNSWAQFMSKDVPIYVHHMQTRFGQEIINNLSPVCHVYSLYCNLSKFMREYIWYFGYYFAKIFAWKVFLFCTKIVQKTFLFPTEQVTIQCPQENSPKTTFKPKSSHFSLLFCQKVIFNYNNSIQTSCRNHLYLWPHFTIL